MDRLASAVRRANKIFEKVGGTSRHWVRECFTSSLEGEGLQVVEVETSKVVEDPTRRLTAAVRRADLAYRQAEPAVVDDDASLRFWMLECFLPALCQEGVRIEEGRSNS